MTRLESQIRPLGDFIELASGGPKPLLLVGKPISDAVIPVFGGNGVMGFSNEWNFEGRLVVIGRVGAHCGNVKYFEGKAWVTDNALFVSNWKSGADPSYFSYLLSAMRLNRLRSASGQPLVTQKPILASKGWVPLPGIQKKLAGSLQQFDSILGSIQSGLRLKFKLKHGLMQQLLTGQKRFPEFVRSNQQRSGEFGKIPADWELAPIGGIADEIKKRGIIEGAEVYSCTKHEGLVLSRDYFGKQVYSRKLDNYKQVQVGDFAYATNHIEEGSIGLLRPGNPVGLVSPMYTVFRPVQEINSEFLFAVLKTENYRRVFEARTNASVNRRGSLRWRDLSKIKVPVPPRPEQDRIAEMLQMAQDEIDLLKDLKATYENYKKGLLSRLLSGELELPDS